MRNPTGVADYVACHPGCGISDLLDGVPNLADAADAWDSVIMAERDGLLRSEHPEGRPWRLYPVASR